MKIFLEKEGFQKTLEINTRNMKSLLKAAPKLKKYIKEDWQIIEVQGQGWAADLIREEMKKSTILEDAGKKYKIGLNVVRSAYTHSPHKDKISFKRIKKVLKRRKH